MNATRQAASRVATPVVSKTHHMLVTRRRRTRARRAIVLVILIVLAVGLALTALAVNDVVLPLSDVLAFLVGDGERTATRYLVFRYARVQTAVLVGAGLGAAGALFQSSLGNTLASPDVIGVTQGACVGAVLMMLTFKITDPTLVSAAALIGALAVSTLNLLLAWRGGMRGHRFILCGIGLSFVAASVLGYLLTRSNLRDVSGALVWLTGAVSEATDRQIVQLAGLLAVLLPTAAFFARRIAVLEMGDDTAAALGVAAGPTRIAALVVGAVLAASATAVAGALSFVALTAPPIARRLVGAGRPAILASAVVGALIVLASDFAAQRLFPGHAVPAGVVTGLIGGPYLLWLLIGAGPGRRSA